jgi:large subunit ribosomal protein L23
MIDPRDIIVAPIISEKSHSDLQRNKYYFKVARKASKTDIEKAIESLFSVKVEQVNIISKRGKEKSMGRFKGFTPNWKKAIVTIRKDQKIPGFFEGM